MARVALSLPATSCTTCSDSSRSLASTSSGKARSCTLCRVTRVCRAWLLRAMYSASMSWLTTRQALRTMACKSFGSFSKAWRLIRASRVVPGSCQPG